MPTDRAYIVFSDVKGFSKLTDGQLERFATEVWPAATEPLRRLHGEGEIAVLNSWGDALILVFGAPRVMAAVLAYRDFFRKLEDRELPRLSVRISAHFGEVYSFVDGTTGGRPNVVGVNVNTAARLEPVTRPGDIFVTRELVERYAEDEDSGKPELVFDDLGELPLPKGFGDQQVFRLRRPTEKRHILDRLARPNEDLLAVLPAPEPLTAAEEQALAGYRQLPAASLAQLLGDLDGEKPAFRLELADLCRRVGLYTEALELCRQLENESFDADGLTAYPLRSDLRLAKIKANCLTRLGDYQAAAEILHGFWQGGARDGDTLSMLAAQYKRRALYTDGGALSNAPNEPLLRRARALYLEAFRRDIGNPYPALNAAYLGVLLGGDDRGRGRLLARHLDAVWGEELGRDWWITATLAECALLDDDFEVAEERFRQGLERCRPDPFELAATLEQLKLYRHFMPGEETRLDDVVALLEGALAAAEAGSGSDS